MLRSSISRRDMLASMGVLAGTGILSALSPDSILAEGITPRAVATGTTFSFSKEMYSGQVSSGASYIPWSYIDMYGTVSSWGEPFGPSSIRGRMYLQGTAGTYTQVEPYPYVAVYGNSTTRARFSHLFDVSNYTNLGIYDGYFYADMYVGDYGWSQITNNSGNSWSSVYVSWGGRSSQSPSLPLFETTINTSYDSKPRHIAVRGNSGKQGFVYQNEFDEPIFSDISDYLDFYNENDSRTINVYDESGDSVIDKYTILYDFI